MKTKKIKAHKMWQSYTGTVWANKLNACMCSIKEKPERAYVLPADAESVSDMIAQVATALCASRRIEGMTMNWAACAALAAIGINARAPKS
jgi:hypothetical protein